ncbi:MAG: glycosyltransferase family 4 protein [Candidatus Woesearchaeota archaeon]
MKKNLKILMFGWEFPPYNFGGLGTACYGLTKGLTKKGIKITFVVPKGSYNYNFINVVPTTELYIENKKFKVKYLDSLLMPYMNETSYQREYDLYYKNTIKIDSQINELYGRNLLEEVNRFAEKASVIAKFEDFDIIHCHDWLTFKAGIIAKKISGKPLIVHVHATEFDRTGNNPNQAVYDIEREGMIFSDRIIAVSNYTKNIIVKNYGIPEYKIHVVHNGIDKKEKKQITKNKKNNKNAKTNNQKQEKLESKNEEFFTDEKIVLFLGRLTLQKGPDYFLESAKKVLKIMPNVKFVVAGTGDMYKKMIDKASEYGLSSKVLFTGHLSGKDVDKAYQMADLYVMPSVSEPFGITPLEALNNKTPVLISKQSGVSEVLVNALKVDFWDIDEMTNKIVGALAYNSVRETIIDNSEKELQNLSWDKSAEKCVEVYHKVL